jgi:hypothetical protein
MLTAFPEALPEVGFLGDEADEEVAVDTDPLVQQT